MALLIGLTGGIASGKSTVSGMLEELGARLIDADRAAREVVRPGSPALAEIGREFGKQVLQENGELDRRKLKEAVFTDPEKRKRLEAITHQRIAENIAVKVRGFLDRGDDPIVIEAALLIETSADIPFDHLVVVTADIKTQLSRLKKRDGLTEEEGEKILATQMPTEQKTKYADTVIENNGSLIKTRRQVEQLWRKLSGQ